MNRVYLDAAPVIYEVEHSSVTIPAALQRAGVADYMLVASEMTRLECRVKPLREHDAILLMDYETFFGESVSEVVPLSREVMDRAAEIRAVYGFRTPDAIHLAAARVSGCNIVLTNDLALSRYRDMRILTVREIQT